MRIAIALLIIVSCAAPPLAAADREPGAGAKRHAPLAVGELAPDFTLEDQNGRRRTLSGQQGKQPVVLAFYRGYW